MINPNDYLWLVKKIAWSYAQRLSPWFIFQYEDLISEGTIGLMDAIKKFDNVGGRKFSTYAGYRINGQICDAFRRIDCRTRTERQNGRKIDFVPLEEDYRTTKNLQDVALLKKEEAKNVMKILGKLIPRQRLVLLLRYFEDRTLEEIGKILRVNESQAHHIHTDAINKMRENYGEFAK